MAAAKLDDKIQAFLQEKFTTEMRQGGVLDLEKFAKKIGIANIYKAEFGSDSVSGLLKKEDEEWNIYVNGTDNPRRRRFTIAHEIGHFVSFLNGGESKKTLDDKGEISDLAFARGISRHTKLEEEANAIAAQLLMPEGDVRDLVEKGKNVEELAAYFEVSETAMSIRLNSLGLTPFEFYGQYGGATQK